MRIVALTTCHNRRNVTLSSLSDLHAQDLPDDVSISFVIVDDGSTDGTAKAVREKFPEVEVLHGTGSLFWAGGMRFGWENSVRRKSFDALLVFNDDIRLDRNALRVLVAVSRLVAKTYSPLHAVAGAFTDSSGENITYGGFRRSSKWHPLRFELVEPTGLPLQIDTLNMNLGLITAGAVRKVGFLASYFKHNKADIEFGHRLRKSGGTIWLSPTAVGVCERNLLRGTSKEAGISMLERWRRLCSIREEPILQRARYCREYGGVFWPVFWVIPYLRVLIEGFFRR